MKIQALWRHAVRGLFATAILVAAGGVAINSFILRKSRGNVFSDAGSALSNDVALVLGAAPRLAGGARANPFFDGRMDAASALFRAGKTRHLIVSGDNSRREYDEPTAMRDALAKRGVPVSAITLDYAGFRTLDSVARARSVFGQDRVTIVSDDFHMPRALFLAKSRGVEAIGFTSAPVPLDQSRKTRLREVAARIAAWVDVFVLRTAPKFEGPPEAIQITRS